MFIILFEPMKERPSARFTGMLYDIVFSIKRPLGQFLHFKTHFSALFSLRTKVIFHF